MTRYLIVIIIGMALVGCSSAPKKNLNLEALRASLESLESDKRLQGLAEGELAEAKMAVRRAELLGESAEEREHLVYLAERRIDLARVKAELEREQRRQIDLERAHDKMLVESSLREADRAREAAERSRRESIAQAEEAARLREEAQMARNDAAREAKEKRQAQEAAADARRLAEAQAQEARLARRKAELASAQTEALRRQLQNVEAQATDRGLSLTLGNDVLFEVNQSRLKAGASDGMGRVLQLVNREYPDRKISVEGHTDSRGSDASNQRLSQDRADSVRVHLVSRGLESTRVRAEGRGEARPIADNSTAEGRANNRRVEIVVEPPR